MTHDEERIRAVIEAWAAAVDAGDVEGVVAAHTADVVMFDVPPPSAGHHGLADYRAAWPEFLRWQAAEAVFEIVSLEVAPGQGTAFAYATIRCGTPADLAARPGLLLRVTFGLRETDGAWLIAHEHHSFPLPAREEDRADGEIRALHGRWATATADGDLDALMAEIADAVVSYEHEDRLSHEGVAEVREVCARGLDAGRGAHVAFGTPDLTVLARDDLAVSWGLDRVTVTPSDGPASTTWSRGTRVFQRRNGHWRMVHQHVSFPVSSATGLAVTDAAP